MKLFGKSLNILTFWIFALLIANVRLAELETNIQTQTQTQTTMELNSYNFFSKIANGKKFTSEQQKELDSIKKPDMPNEISANLNFMDKELAKAYKQASQEYNPRFVEADEMNKKFMSLFPHDKGQEGTPLKREV